MSAPAQTPSLLSVRDVAAQLGVCVKWVYEHQIEFRPVRVGRKLRFRQASVDAFVEQQEIAK
jgi:excisionase family DNA binding protein